MKLMVFDPHDRGHYLTYVRYLLAGARLPADVVLVVRRGAAGSKPFQEQVLPVAEGVTIDESIGPENFLRPQALVADFRAAVLKHQPDHVWVPSGDMLVHAVTLAGFMGRWSPPRSTEIEAGLVELRFHRRATRFRGRLRQAVERTLYASGRWTRLHTIDPTVWSWVQASDGRLAKRLSLVPDPLEPFPVLSKETARRQLGIPESGRLLVAAGGHAIPRKGTGLLIEAFAKARLADDDRLLLAGELGASIRHVLSTTFSGLCRSGRILTMDKYLNDGQLMTAVSAADLVCTPYQGHWGSSGIVLRAAQLGRPVLAPNVGWLGDMVPKFKLGAAVAIADAPSLAVALTTALAQFPSLPDWPMRDRLIQYGTAENFARAWSVRLRARLGLQPDPHRLTWDWVERGEASP